MARSFHFLKYEDDGKKRAEDCLFAWMDYKTIEPHERIVTSEFVKKADGTGGFGEFRLEYSRSSFFNRILSLPEDKRHSCTNITEDQMVLLYLDLEFEVRYETDTMEVIHTFIQTAIQFIKEMFEKTYPANDLHVDNFWIFSASTESKISLHVHADPCLSGVVWKNAKELRMFMIDAQTELSTRHEQGDKITECLFRLNKKQVLKTFIDFGVYSASSQNVKLPLCSKPGKETMKLLHKPVDAKDWSLTTQLNVGMITVRVLDDSIQQLLPSIITDEITSSVVKQKRQKTNQNVSYITSTDARKPILLQLLKPYVGEMAAFYQVSITERNLQGSFTRGSAICVLAKRLHKSNGVKFNGYLHDSRDTLSIHLSCFDDSCHGNSRLIQSFDIGIINCLFPIHKRITTPSFKELYQTFFQHFYDDIKRLVGKKQTANILIIVSRNSLVKAFVNALSTLKFQSYTDCQNAARLVIVFDSLPKLVSSSIINKSWDLIAFDEIDSCFEQFDFNSFGGLIEYAKQVVCLNEQVSENCLKLLLNFRGNIHFLKNNFNIIK